MDFVKVKGIITPTSKNDEYFARSYNMNIYRGCSHGCIYCDSRSDCYHLEDFDIIRGKENAIEIIENELKNKRKTGIIGTGSMSDPYNPFEKIYELTRKSLKMMDKYRFGVTITTKSSLVTRDIDVFQDIMTHSPVNVIITITTTDDDLSKLIEPNVNISSERFDAVKKLSEAGILAGVYLNPVIPFITDGDKNLVEMVERAAACGAKYILNYMGMTLRQGNREYFYKNLDINFKGIKEKYIRTYGLDYMLPIPEIDRKWRLFDNECKKYNLVNRMSEINKLILNSGSCEQIGLT